MSSEGTSLELVVSHYEEDLAWLRRVPAGFRTMIYSKGSDPPDGSVVLPNRGREAHSYLHHIVSNYDTLADTTVFAQGKPFDHAHDFHRTLRGLAEGSLVVRNFQWLGFILDTDDSLGRRLFVPWSKNPDRSELPMPQIYGDLFGRETPEWFRFRPGAQFIVSREQVRSRSLRFYETALEISLSHPLAAHCFERFWDQLFGLHAITDADMKGEQTLYLKRIQRLEADRQAKRSME